MPTSENLETELKQLIIDALLLEDIAPADIDSEAPLFHEGLGLDSIDSLDLAMALEERYGLHIAADSEENGQLFASVKNLAEFVETNRAR